AFEQMHRAAAREREFVRDASHQLKTPIAVARGMADLMRQSKGSQRDKDLDDLVEELDRLGRIAQGMLTIAAAEQIDNLVVERVDFEDIVVSAARRWSRTAERAWGVEVRAEGTLVADRDRIDAALDAVIENAVAATSEEDSVVIIGRAHGGDAILEVSDTGV